MKRTSPTRAPLLIALVLLPTIGFLVAGCQSDDLSTAPEVIQPVTVAEIIGEVTPPGLHSAKLPLPSNFEAVVQHRHRIRLNWDLPAIGYDAIIVRDGLVVVSVDARRGFFIDRERLEVGEHVYELYFQLSNSAGLPVEALVNILPESGSGKTVPEEE